MYKDSYRSSTNNKYNSFNSAKSTIINSALGKALTIASDATISTVTDKIKNVAVKTSGSQSVSTSGKYGFTTQYGPWMYIPANAYYTTSHWLNIPWDTFKGLCGTANAGQILTGYTATSQNGIKISGTMKNWSSTIQTATTSASDQTKSCYRINNGYIEVVPAIGYWGLWDWSKSCIKVAITNLASSVIKIVSGTQNSSGSYKITWGGSAYTTTAINVNPGGTPIAAFAANISRSDTFTIRFMSSYFVCGNFNSGYNVSPSSCSWTSSSVVLPAGTTNYHSMTYYIAVLK